jgi:hypothetical protein
VDTEYPQEVQISSLQDTMGRMNKNGAFAWEHEQGAKANCGLSKIICSTLNE